MCTGDAAYDGYPSVHNVSAQYGVDNAGQLQVSAPPRVQAFQSATYVQLLLSLQLEKLQRCRPSCGTQEDGIRSQAAVNHLVHASIGGHTGAARARGTIAHLNSLPSCLRRDWKMTARAGALTPIAKVSVQNRAPG